MTLKNTIKIAFDNFKNLEAGKPIRLIPEGIWFRGRRKLEITSQRLMDMEKNFKSQLPQFPVLINLDHKDDNGKVGDITDVAYIPDGAEGPGLYVTDFKLTAKGEQAIEEDGYDGVSAEIVWTLNDGAKFQDPKTGNWHDNVLVGMALTPKPFFGREVAIFTADEDLSASDVAPGVPVSFEELEAIQNASNAANTVAMLSDKMQMLVQNILSSDIRDKRASINSVATEWEKRVAEISEDFSDEPKTFIEKAKEFVQSIGAPAPEENPSTEETMSDEKEITEVVEELEATEETVSRDEFAAMEQANQTKIEALQADLMAERHSRVEKELRGEAEAFKALSIEIDEYTVKMGELKESSPDLAAWVHKTLTGADVAMFDAGLMAEAGAEFEAEVKTLDDYALAIVDEQFDGDGTKYDTAFKLAAKEHPELVTDYSN